MFLLRGLRWTARFLLACGLAPAALAVNSGRVEYYHHDALGNVRVVTDETGQVIERHDYLPFGEECTTGACAANLGVAPGQPRRFAGKERDTETGLDYFGARYYGSKVGRFTTVDPLMTIQENLLDPQRWNRYAHVRNNPQRFVDPDGRDVFDYFGGVANAFGSNFLLGAGRVARDNADFRFGQFVGDVFSIPVGVGVAQSGTGTAGLGVIGAPETAGASLAVTAGGVVLAAAGSSATLNGSRNAGLYLASRVDDLAGGPRRRAVRSLEAQVAGHRAKLEAYRENPDAHDTGGILKKAPNEEIRQRIIQGRIRHLENEIKTFEDQLAKLRE